jgi:hypothetical protein
MGRPRPCQVDGCRRKLTDLVATIVASVLSPGFLVSGSPISFHITLHTPPLVKRNAGRRMSRK